MAEDQKSTLEDTRGLQPANHPDWLPFAVIGPLLSQRAGHPAVAAHDLRQALFTGSIRSICRDLADPSKCGWVPSDYWESHEVSWSEEGGARLLNLMSDGRAQRIRVFLAFYVWGPDIRKQWPDLLPAPEPDEAGSDEPEYIRKVRAEYPNGVPKGRIKIAWTTSGINLTYRQFRGALIEYGLRPSSRR